MKNNRGLFFICIFIGSYLPAFSWGANGHRIVGAIAESYLTPGAKKQIEQILGNESLAISSTWADFVKSDSTFKFLDTWHYVNLEDSLNREQVAARLVANKSANAFNKINFLISELKKKQPHPETQRMYLRLLIHLIGDIHQPMHVGRAEDLGGNRIRVVWFNDNTNLHSVWDTQILESQKLSYTEYTTSINFTTPQQRIVWQQQPLTDWFFESYQISRRLYEEIKEPNQKLSYRYSFDHIETVNEQLLKAGVRLAGVLNDIYK